MTTKEEFLTDFGGHGNAYASFILIDVKLDDVIETLNRLRPDGCFGSGEVEERSIYFEGCKESPYDLLEELTCSLNCTGFSMMGSWYGCPMFVARKNGEEYNDFTATFNEGYPCLYEPDDPQYEDEWDVCITIKDNPSGVTFETGEGCICGEYKDMFAEIVAKHIKK